MPGEMMADEQEPERSDENGVLAALPRTRPQRASARRVAARAATRSETVAEAVASPPAPRAPKTARSKPPEATRPKPPEAARSEPPKESKPSRRGARPKVAPSPKVKREARVPKQGYEPEEEVELGKTVDPPSGVELIESLADIVGELVSAGAGAGGRLLKDALSIFHRP